MTIERLSGDLGRKLREARERKGVSLRQIANSTKIAVAVLDGLERNDISKLPGGIFGRAFVRSFATEVGLDPEATIQEFIAQFRDDSVAAGHPPSEQIEDNEALESKRRMAWTFLSLIALSIPVAAVITYLGFAGARGSSAAVARPAATHVEPSADALAAGAPAQSTAGAPAQSTASAPDQSAASADTIPSPAVAAEERPVPAAALSDRLIVGLAASRACWVSATVDGHKEMERLLMAGDRRSLEVRSELDLSVGDAGAVTMTINGVEAKPLGRSGEVVKIRLNPTNSKTFLPAR